ncbi:hypothetical protein [Labrenzia sp. OB1]|uniref:hypothetical protein n=1 Tax=Labrenzia sp. OB1 TaxID=1561204 RepID=UPI0007B2C892|nr:hypothetical protein [Labrenzia sp. OB1]KZM49525.1 hypothetical protein OA90_13590 [Labrenzia sp. OB1]
MSQDGGRTGSIAGHSAHPPPCSQGFLAFHAQLRQTALNSSETAASVCSAFGSSNTQGTADFGTRRGGFAFVTLGPAFDCLGGYGAQRGFGEAMATIARSSVDWTGLHSPHDPICCGRTPPIARYAALTKADCRKPEHRRFSICIPDRMAPATFRYLRHRLFKLHICYFFASVTPGVFDFCRLTIGPKRAVEQLKAWNTWQD